jgi:hypothetical protein
MGSSSDIPGPEYSLTANRKDSSTAVLLESDSNSSVELVGPENPSILQRYLFTDKAFRGGGTNIGRVRLMNGLLE